MKNNWNKILNELSYRVSSGIPDLTKEQHLMKLWDILKEEKWPINARVELLKNLEEAVGKVYVQKGPGPEGAKMQVGPKGGRYYMGDKKTGKPAEEPKKKVSKDKSTKSIPKGVDNILNMKHKGYKKLEPILTDDDKKQLTELKTDMEDFLKNPTKEKAEALVKKFDLSSNTGKDKKLYIGSISPAAYKILGQGKNVEHMVKQIEGALGKTISSGKKVKAQHTRAGEYTKPQDENIGNPTTAADSKFVNDFYNPENNPSFDGMEEKYRKLYIAKDKDGNELIPSNKYADENLALGLNHLESVKKKLEQDKNIDPRITKAVSEYYDEQKRILAECKGKFPSDECADKLKDAYGRYSQKLIETDPKTAKSMLKNQAEIMIYQDELARGEEVYLPAHPSYPGADKLVKSSDGIEGEKVTGISVKVGKDGSVKVMGFPTESKQMLRYHTDKKYRKNVSSVPGEDGFATGIKDETIDSDEEMNNLMSESGMDKVITNQEEYIKTIREYKEWMINFKKKHNYNGKGPLPEEARKELDDKKKEILERVNKLVDMDKLIEMTGEKNAAAITKKSPGALLAFINYKAASKTAGGIKGLNSHTQKITDSGVKLATKATPNDCKKLSIRTYREHEKSSSARNGGLLIGVEHPDEDKGENI
jgi:hypothetical protein